MTDAKLIANPETGEIQVKPLATAANKNFDFWASMRTNLSLISRSEKVHESVIDVVIEELRSILDSGILSYPNTLQQLGIEQNQPLEERKKNLAIESCIPEHSENEKKFLRNMAHKADNMRKSNWSWRIGQEAMEKHALGWYPFFVTLTIDPMKTDPKQLWVEGREFRKYIRRLVNIVCKELKHKPAHHKPYRPESDYVTYAGVIEHGKSREHHHGHFIIWMRSIPASWRTCPNMGIRNPANRTKNECLPMRTLWPWSLPGLSPALYFRSVGDIWEKSHHFVLPLKDGKPMKVSTPKAAGHYITKYLAKEHREWHHRMKATRNLGMKKLRLTIQKLQLDQVEALAWRAPNSELNHSLMMTHNIPLGLVRSLAKRQVFLIKYMHNQLDLTELLQSNSQIFTRMLMSVRSGIRPDRMDSCQFYDWVSQLLPAQKGYCEKRQLSAHLELGKYFPHIAKRVKSVKQGANDI